MQFRPFIFATLIACFGSLAQAEMAPRDGWVVIPTQMSHSDLVAATRKGVKAAGMAVVTKAGPTKAAANRGITIPGNVVIGAYNNDFAVRVLATSTAAMIEAPIRFYVTEDDAGSATLSYKIPRFVFGPYMAEADPDLATAAAELDAIFLAIAEAAR